MKRYDPVLQRSVCPLTDVSCLGRYGERQPTTSTLGATLTLMHVLSSLHRPSSTASVQDLGLGKSSNQCFYILDACIYKLVSSCSPGQQLVIYEFVACLAGILPYFDFKPSDSVTTSGLVYQKPELAESFTASLTAPLVVDVRIRDTGVKTIPT